MVTLAHLSKRPPILGLGAGVRENVEPDGLDFSTPVSRLEEAIQVIRLCLDSGGASLDFAGQHFRLDAARFDLPVPLGRKPEIWVGALGPRVLRLTGRYGDGWYPVGMLTPDEYADKLAAVHAAALDAGRNPESITPIYQPNLVVAPSEREARAMLDAPLVRYLGLLLPADRRSAIGAPHPFGDGFRGCVDILPERLTRQKMDVAMAALPPELAEIGVIWGTPERVAASLRPCVEAGVRYFVPQPISAMLSRRAALTGIFALRIMLRRSRHGDPLSGAASGRSPPPRARSQRSRSGRIPRQP